MLSILTQFLSNRSQHVMVDRCRSKLVNVVSEVPQSRVLARCCSSCTLQSFFHPGKQADQLCQLLHFDGCCAIPRR